MIIQRFCLVVYKFSFIVNYTGLWLYTYDVIVLCHLSHAGFTAIRLHNTLLAHYYRPKYKNSQIFNLNLMQIKHYFGFKH